MAFSESLVVYFRLKSEGGLADPAVFNGATNVAVLSDTEFLGREDLAGHSPSVLGKTSDFAASAIGKTLVINGGITHKIMHRQLIDDGLVVRLELEEQ